MSSLVLIFLVIVPLECIGQNVGISPNIFVPDNQSKQSDVCLYALRQTQMCLNAHPNCRKEELGQLTALIETLAFQCGQGTMAQQVAPNPTSPFSAKCSGAGSTFLILFIIFAAGFLLAIAGLAAMLFLHFRRK